MFSKLDDKPSVFRSMAFTIAACLCAAGLFADEDVVVENCQVDVCLKTEELYFVGRNLMDVKDLAITAWQKFGGSTDTREYLYSAGPLTTAGTFNKSGIYLYENDGSTLTFEFHGHTFNSYSGVGNGFKLQLVQRGNDIYGQVLWQAGFTGADPFGFDVTWESKKGSGAYDTESLYSTYGTNLKLYFSTSSATSRTVTFVGIDGETVISTYIVEAGSYAAVAPTPPDVEGYVFYAWDSDFSNVQSDMTVTALYHRLFTVVFKDADGTVLKTEAVEETMDATAPDMTGKANFIGWDSTFSAVSCDMVVTAVYGTVPEAVTIANETGLLEYEENVLIWTEAEDTWNAESLNWCTKDGVRSAWRSGATAVFPVTANVSVDGTPQASRIYLIGDAETVTFTGAGSATVAAGGTMCFGRDATVVVEGTLTLGDGVSICMRDRHDDGEVPDVLPTDMSVVVRGNLDMGASMAVSDGVVLKTAGEGLLENGTVTGEITLSGDAVLEMSSTAAQTMSGKITVAQVGHGYVITKPGSDVSFNSSKGASWELRVAGDSYVVDYRTLPQAASSKGQTWVLNGGTLRMGKANSYWGPEVWSDEGLYVEQGGAVRLLSNQSLGAIMGVCVNGGSVTNESTNIDSLLYKMQLNDGALLTGKPMRVGFISYYETWSYIASGGAAPSKVSLDEIQIGYQFPAQDKKYVGINFKVADVTEDDATDLLVTSPITERQDVKLFNEGFRDNLGVWKQGAGTLELAADSTSCATGVFKIEAGTVRFPEAAAGDFGALVVLGDSEFEVARGARITFDASSDFAWTEGKMLVFSGTMGRKSVRIGTSAAALTAEQLAAVKFRSASGKLRPMTIDGDGYLMALGKGVAISVR